jgi:uncharacterized protein YjbI with pentapeptide repeats
MLLLPSLKESTMKTKTALNPAPTAPLAVRLGYTLVCLGLYFSGLGNRWGTISLPRVFYPDVERLVLPLVFSSKEEKDLQFNLYEREGWFGGRGIVGRFKLRVTFPPEGGIKFTCRDLWDFNPGAFSLEKWKGLMVFVHFLEKWTGLKGIVKQDWGDRLLLDESLLSSLNSTHEFSHEWELEYSPEQVEELRNQFLQLLRAGLGEEAQVNLSGADLSGVDLSGAKLRGANLNEANLSGANLRGADLSYGDLSGANLSGADLYGADLSGADLYGADLSGANLSGADLSGANLRQVDLREVDLSGANLSGADLYGADLSGANLSGADLSGADLRRADLRRVDLSGANLEGALLPY